MENDAKPVIYLGSTLKDLMKMPSDVKDTFSLGLYTASMGDTPLSSKGLKGYGGRSVVELLEDHNGDTFRAVYTVRFRGVIYVLHVFKKKSKSGISTPKKDKKLIEKRLKDASAHYKLYFKQGKQIK